MKRIFLLLLLTATSMRAIAANEPSAPVKSWLAAQAKIHTWSANLIQTRTLLSLTEPLKANGRVWFEDPGRFRWELGDPPKTIAINTISNLYIIYPRLKRVESISLTSAQQGPWRSALDMLQAGFPRTEAEMVEHYNIQSQDVTGDICKLKLVPRVEALRQMMPHLEIDFDTKEFLLRGTELEFADGSTMRNDFSDIVTNPKVDAAKFNADVPSDYTIVHPQIGR